MCCAYNPAKWDLRKPLRHSAHLGAKRSSSNFNAMRPLSFSSRCRSTQERGGTFRARHQGRYENGLLALQLGFNVSVREIPIGKKPIVVPLFDFEIEDAEAEALKLKIAEAKKTVCQKAAG